MSNTLFIKDFEIRSFRAGSRIQNGPEWSYEIIYRAPSGKSVRLERTFATKGAAKKYIRETIKLANLMRKRKENWN